MRAREQVGIALDAHDHARAAVPSRRSPPSRSRRRSRCRARAARQPAASDARVPSVRRRRAVAVAPGPERPRAANGSRVPPLAAAPLAVADPFSVAESSGLTSTPAGRAAVGSRRCRRTRAARAARRRATAQGPPPGALPAAARPRDRWAREHLAHGRAQRLRVSPRGEAGCRRRPRSRDGRCPACPTWSERAPSARRPRAAARIVDLPPSVTSAEQRGSSASWFSQRATCTLAGSSPASLGSRRAARRS